MPPFLAINTTTGTASEVTRFCIITNTDTHVKMAIVDWRVTPNVAINDPLLMAGMPPGLTAATGMDALTHAIEAYVSTIATPITDACAIKAMELVRDFLPAAVAHGQNMEARDKMAYAEYLAGMAFNNASLGYVHAMAHQLGGFYNLPHGVCNAILLPVVCEYNIIACPKRFKDIAIALGQDVAVSPIWKRARRPFAPSGDCRPRWAFRVGWQNLGFRNWISRSWLRTPRRMRASLPTRAQQRWRRWWECIGPRWE